MAAVTPRDRNRLAAAVAQLRAGHTWAAEALLEAGEAQCKQVLLTWQKHGPTAAIRDAEERMSMEDVG